MDPSLSFHWIPLPDLQEQGSLNSAASLHMYVQFKAIYKSSILLAMGSGSVDQKHMLKA